MEETEQTKNTGFVYVKNYLANLICDILEDGENTHMAARLV